MTAATESKPTTATLHERIIPPASSWAIGAWVATLLLITALIALGVLARQFQVLKETRETMGYSGVIIAEITAIRDRYVSAMGGIRQYVERHNPKYLENFNKTRRELPGMFQKLQQQTLQPKDRDQAARLQTLMTESLAECTAVVNRYQITGSAEEVFAFLDNKIQVNSAALNFYVPWRDYHIAQVASADLKQKQQLRVTNLYALSIGIASALATLLMVTLLIRDTRRRMQMTHQLQVSSDLWRGTVGTLVQGVAVYSIDRRLFFWNEQFAQLTGIPPEVLHVGMHNSAVIRASIPFVGISSESAVEHGEKNFHAVCANQPTQFEHQRVDGTTIRIDVRLVSKNYYVVAMTDVTALHRSQAKARDQATRLAAIMDHVPDGIITLDVHGKIESWSQGAERIFGYQAGVMSKRDFHSLLDFGQAASQSIRDIGVGQRRALQARHCNGHRFPIDLLLSEVQIAGQPMLVGIVRDITEQQRIEQMKSEFIATVSHELRTPLTSIRGALALLSSDVHPQSPANIQRLLNIASQNSERLTRLINDILDVEKADSGQLTLTLQPHSLRTLAMQAIEANRAYAEQHQIDFKLHCEADETILADSDRIMQVLANLLSNAAKFSPHGSEVKVQVRRAGTQMRVSVQDQGPGVPGNFMARIFSRFAQADASNTRRAGSGLGLAIAKSLIEHHGGQVGFYNASPEAGGGAVFWFELPIDYKPYPSQIPRRDADALHYVD